MPQRMPLELKALLAAVTAGLAVVGASFGLAAIVRSGTPAGASSPAPMNGTASIPSSSRSNDSAHLVQGHVFYTQSCAVCHGVGGQGGGGPSLIGLGLDDPQITETIRDGVKGDMPAFGQKYQKPQVQAIITYIRSLKKPDAKKPLPL